MSIPSMPLFCGDYLKDTTDLTLEEHGAYLMILMITWATGGKPLPDNDVRMAKRLSITKDRWANKLKPVLAQFFDLSGGTWRNQRLEQEWNYVQESIAAKRANGAMGGRPRKRGPQNGPGNGQFSDASVQCNLTESCDANSLENNETTKANGSGLHKQTESTQPPYSSAYAEEREVDTCVSLESTPCAPVREAVLTQAPPVSSATKATNVVQFQPGRSSEVLPIPDDWTLPNDWYLLAIKAGWHDPEGAAERFHTHWLGKRDRGDRDAANSEAVWLKLWQGWINRNLKWERDHGKQLGGKQQQDHGLTAYVKSDLLGSSGYAEADPDDGGRRIIRG